MAADKGFTSSLVSGSKQDQKLGFHPKVFNRPADKDFNNGLYAFQRRTEVDGADAIFIVTINSN